MLFFCSSCRLMGYKKKKGFTSNVSLYEMMIDHHVIRSGYPVANFSCMDHVLQEVS